MTRWVLCNMSGLTNSRRRQGSPHAQHHSDCALVWQVVSIPFFKWQALTTLQARSQFLRELLPLSTQAQEDRPATTPAMPFVPSLQGTVSGMRCDLRLVWAKVSRLPCRLAKAVSCKDSHLQRILLCGLTKDHRCADIAFRQGTEAAHAQQSPGVSAFRARSLSEDTVRVHPSPAPSVPGPLQLSRHASQDSSGLREAGPSDFMSQLMASQQLPGLGEARTQESGSVPALQQGIPIGGLMANLSDPGALASLPQTGDVCLPKHMSLAAVL